jgi:hypothetical protein
MPRTLADDLVDDAARNLSATDHFAEAVTRYALGVTASSTATTGIFTETEPTQDKTRGESNARVGDLLLAESVTVDPRDTWLIGGEVWQTLSVSGPQHGMRTLKLTKVERMRSAPRTA